MKIEEVIRQRRSIRQYTGQMPKEKDVQAVLAAARWAPSGLNNQPWRFKIVREEVKAGLAEFTECDEIIKEAPAAICVFLDNRASYNRDKDLMAVGASIQNMLLRACELGLGTCWLGEILNRRKEVERYLGIDPDYELMAVITLGHAAKKAAKGQRRALKSLILDQD